MVHVAHDVYSETPGVETCLTGFWWFLKGVERNNHFENPTSALRLIYNCITQHMHSNSGGD